MSQIDFKKVKVKHIQ